MSVSNKLLVDHNHSYIDGCATKGVINVKYFICPTKKCKNKIAVGSTVCPKCNKIIDIFDRHNSPSLFNRFAENKYQGQNPRDAKVVFIGRDANFAKDISSYTYIFNILLEYLRDGVTFWENSDNPEYWENCRKSDKRRKVHHPFLLPSYRILPNRDGCTYHGNFSLLQLGSQYAEHISFVEIIDVPTEGFHLNDPGNLVEQFILNSRAHIEALESHLLSGDKKVVFISDMAIDALGRLGKLTKLFQSIYEKKDIPSGGISELVQKGNVTVYKCYHFSAPHARRKNHRESLRCLINEYVGINN